MSGCVVPEGEAPSVRRYSETRYGAKSWRCVRRVAARIEATTLGLDIRYVVTSHDAWRRRMTI
jgi:hypothetical protein